MKDPRISRLADLLVNYSVFIQPGETVEIRGTTLSEPLLLEVYKKVLLAGGHPITRLSSPEANEIFYKYASDEQLRFIHKPLQLVIEEYDAVISLIAEENTKALSNVDPGKMVIASQARKELSKLFMERAARKELKWTLSLFPTHASAQEAEMSLSDYEDFVYNACMPDKDDPVGYWTRIYNKQQKVVEWLSDKENVHVKGPGTDLRLRITGRKFINCACKENVPDGEIFTGPIEDSVEGHVTFSYPAIYSGKEVSNVQLWFEKGKVVKATADKNEIFLNETLDTDEGARYVGEFAIGTNEGIQQFTREILFDEKIGGSFHMALGASYPESGGLNESAIHWDMICDLREGGEIEVDDQLMYKNGKFVLDV
ncbi:MAG: aminopeptidase [Anaerolineaceae bacterium]|nr:aminopeptidase [Anaerolineaceae bacterium]